MKASDIYGKMQVGAKNTQDDTAPSKNESQAKQAQSQAQGKKGSNTYGTMAILLMIGILVGSKFMLEAK